MNHFFFLPLPHSGFLVAQAGLELIIFYSQDLYSDSCFYFSRRAARLSSV